MALFEKDKGITKDVQFHILGNEKHQFGSFRG